MPASVANEIRRCDWMKMTKKDVIKAISPEAKEMRLRKIHLRTQREERRENGLVGSVE